MKNSFARTGKYLASTLCLLGSAQVLAGPGSVGSVSHSPLSTSVPMLGGVGLVVLSALLAVVSLRFLKTRQHHGGHFLILATITGALAAGGSGFKLINDAQAAPPQAQLTLKGGGDVTIDFEGFTSVLNGTGVPQQITDISAVPGCFVGSELVVQVNGGANGGNGGSFVGTCSDGDDSPATVLNNLEFCEVLICCEDGNGGNGGCPLLD